MSELAVQGESLADAVTAMPDIPMDDYVPNPNPRVEEPAKTEQIRGDDGKWAKAEPKTEAKPVEAKIPGDNAKAAAPADDDEDDWIEEPAEEEGKEPVRYKLQDVLAGYKESKTLREELSKTQSSPVMPADVENALKETISAREQYLSGLKAMYAQQSAPAPDLEMTNPNSPKYDPERFHASLVAYQQAQQTRAEIETHYKELSDRQSREQEAIRSAKWQREQAKLQTVWPEVLTDKAAQAKAKADLAKHYGIDDAFLASDITLDHRIYALAKDALAYRESQAKSAEAVKVVRAKPRVIHGSARQTQSKTQRSSADGYARLSQSGSMDDAVAALDGLL